MSYRVENNEAFEAVLKKNPSAELLIAYKIYISYKNDCVVDHLARSKDCIKRGDNLLLKLSLTG